MILFVTRIVIFVTRSILFFRLIRNFSGTQLIISETHLNFLILVPHIFESICDSFDTPWDFMLLAGYFLAFSCLIVLGTFCYSSDTLYHLSEFWVFVTSTKKTNCEIFDLHQVYWKRILFYSHLVNNKFQKSPRNKSQQHG